MSANSGENVAARFSNLDGSLQSSLGLFVTGTIYQGKNGYSLHLHGLEAGVNDHAYARTIVMHGAWYVSRDQAERFGRIGRSWGCPAVRPEIAKPMIDTLAGGSLREVVFNSIYLQLNAELQLKAAALGPITYLSDGEVAAVLKTRSSFTFERAWEYWCQRAGRTYDVRPMEGPLAR